MSRAMKKPKFKARMAGVFYLITFVAGVLARASASGRFAANLIATAAYVAVTLLFYDLFKPVNRSVSLIAGARQLRGIDCRDSEHVSSLALPDQHPRLFRNLLRSDRLSHFQVDVPATSSGRADVVWRFGVADLASPSLVKG